MARPNFMEKTFMGGSKTAKFMKVFSLESFPLCSIAILIISASKYYGNSKFCLDSCHLNLAFTPAHLTHYGNIRSLS